MNVLTPIHFVGSLGRAIGHTRLDLDVQSPAEAVRAVNVLTNGKLEQYLRGPGAKKMYKIALQKKTNTIDPEQEIGHKSGRSAIYFIPTINGRNSGAAKIVAGVVILALAWYNPAGWAYVAGQAGAAGGGLTALGSIAVGFGVSLVLGGITQLITPAAKGFTSSNSEQKNSTTFAGNALAVVQGGCVPVVYGRALVSPIPISVTVENNDVPTTDAGNEGIVEVDDLQGGGQQYSSGA